MPTEETSTRTIRTTLEEAIVIEKPIVLVVRGSVICGIPHIIDGECVRIARGTQSDSLLGFTRGGVWVSIDSIDGIGEI